jgi:hypothetical protein
MNVFQAKASDIVHTVTAEAQTSYTNPLLIRLTLIRKYYASFFTQTRSQKAMTRVSARLDASLLNARQILLVVDVVEASLVKLLLNGV